MVSEFLIALALVATPAANSGPGAHAEAHVMATIQRGVTVQNGTAAASASDVVPVRQQARGCGLGDQPAPDCRLIVYDLP